MNWAKNGTFISQKQTNFRQLDTQESSENLPDNVAKNAPDYSNDLERLQAHFLKEVRHTKASQRIKKLVRMRKWILTNRNQISEAIYADFKKPPAETELGEIFSVLAEINYAKRHLHSWMAPRRIKAPISHLGTRSIVRNEPKGVSLILGTWNYPFLLSINPLVSAIAAGNCVILKPSEFTPNTSALIERMCGELYDRDEITVVQGGADVAAPLTTLPFNHIFFTGGTGIGKKVMAAAAENLTSVTLELGGSNPCIVLENVNVKDAAKKIVWGKMFNSAQSCLAPNVIYVHKNKEAALREEIKNCWNRLYSSDHPDGPPDIARLIHDEHFNRINSLKQSAEAAGANLESIGSGPNEHRYFPLTLISDISEDHDLVQKETFGPLLPILPFESNTKLIDRLNRRDIPLTLSVFGNRRGEIDSIIAQTRSGSVHVNEMKIAYSYPALPFGGLNASGLGKTHGFAGFQAFSDERPVLRQRIGLTWNRLIYPPYTAFKMKLIRFIVRYF